MKKILFRGKRLDNGEWIQGFLALLGADYYIAPDINAYTSMGGRGKGRCMMFGHYYQVLPETVGQYTGLTDKNGKKIFDSDILFSTDAGDEHSLILIMDEGWSCFLYYYFGGKCHDAEFVKSDDWLSDCEVIGNIHDNPELLEVAE